jgi:BlaI family penicillinase repressor
LGGEQNLMKSIPQISEAELEVMKVLWRLGQAGSSQIIKELTKTTEWKPKTIQTLITRLVGKGAVRAVKADDADKSGGAAASPSGMTTAASKKTNARGSKAFTYSPLISETEFKSDANESFLQKLYNGSVNMMLASFVKQQKLTRAEIEELKKLLDEES